MMPPPQPALSHFPDAPFRIVPLEEAAPALARGLLKCNAERPRHACELVLDGLCKG